jgi:lysophospholipase L1-like esterase
MLFSTLTRWLSNPLAVISLSNDMGQGPLLPSVTTKFRWIQNFASIGDSYSAGLGAGHRLDWLCSRYTHSYPNILHTSLLGTNPNRNHSFLACSGATSTEILATQIPALPSNLDLLTISAGGNDIGLTAILSACIYQFYMAAEDACAQAIDQARMRIASETELYHNTSLLLTAAKQKMNPHHSLVYYTGYATFFGTDDDACDNVTWAVWKDVEWQKQYLTRELRGTLNHMVHDVNRILERAVADAGPGVRFIDYDAEIRQSRGRYCESGVVEPAPNRLGLAFYEWATVDQGENSTALLNRTGDGVPRLSFEAGIAREVQKTLERHPDWEVEHGKGFVDKEQGVGGKGWLGDGVHWLLPDSYKRVFHLRPMGHEVIARMVVEDLEKERW